MNLGESVPCKVIQIEITTAPRPPGPTSLPRGFELPAVGRRGTLLRDPVRGMPPEIGRKDRPLLLGIPQSNEELRLLATDGVGWRQEIVVHLGVVDD